MVCIKSFKRVHAPAEFMGYGVVDGPSGPTMAAKFIVDGPGGTNFGGIIGGVTGPLMSQTLALTVHACML